MYTSLIKVVVSANSFIFKQNTNYCVSSMQTKDKKLKKKKTWRHPVLKSFWMAQCKSLKTLSKLWIWKIITNIGCVVFNHQASRAGWFPKAVIKGVD